MSNSLVFVFLTDIMCRRPARSRVAAGAASADSVDAAASVLAVYVHLVLHWFLGLGEVCSFVCVP
jgi:hypothetical protein